MDSEEEELDVEDGTMEEDMPEISVLRKTVFAHQFREIFDDAISQIQNTTGEENLFNSPPIGEYILETYTPICSLWTGMLLEQKTKHDTNSPAENYMKIIKKDMLVIHQKKSAEYIW